MSYTPPAPGDSSLLPSIPFPSAPGLDAFDELDSPHVDGFSLDRLLASIEGGRPAGGAARPAWLRDLTDCVADLFEPLSHTGRIGFDCRPEGGRWTLDAFLAAAEHVGGRLDGHVEVINFRFDVAALFRCFNKVDDCTWCAFPEPEAVTDGETARGDIPAGMTSLSIEGTVADGLGNAEPVRLRVYSVPPEEAGVGLKLFAGGEAVPV